MKWGRKRCQNRMNRQIVIIFTYFTIRAYVQAHWTVSFGFVLTINHTQTHPHMHSNTHVNDVKHSLHRADFFMRIETSESFNVFWLFGFFSYIFRIIYLFDRHDWFLCFIQNNHLNENRFQKLNEIENWGDEISGNKIFAYRICKFLVFFRA